MIITLRKINKSYLKQKKLIPVINDFSHVFSNGKLYLFKGSSGAGKTTLLSLIGLLDNVDSGEILFDDKMVSEYSEKQKAKIRREDLAFVYQEYNLFEKLTIEENIKVAYMHSDIPNLDKRIGEVLDMVNLSHRIEHYPCELSGGEKQRVAIARALIKKPKLLICDEPISNLDEENANKVIDALGQIKKEGDCIILVSCHGRQLDQYADEIIQL